MNHTRNTVMGRRIVRWSSSLHAVAALALVCGIGLLAAGCQQHQKNEAATQPARTSEMKSQTAQGDVDKTEPKTDWTKDQTLYGFFPPEDQVRDVDRVAAAQAAAGAREDATLYPRHFYQTGKLNSLGRSKLFLMTRDLPADEPVVVYVDAPAADSDQRVASARTDAIRKYLEQGGIAPSRVEVRAGPNPATAYPAAPGIARLNRTDSAGGEGAAGGTAVGASPGGAGYAPGGMSK